jgi:hypothetical protein
MKYVYQSIREFNGGDLYAPLILTGRLGWDGTVRDIAGVYDQLSPADRSVAGIYTDWYYTASAIDMYGPRYGLPHAVSGSLTYYLWGPGYSWDVIVIVTGQTNILSVFFDNCAQKATTGEDPPGKFYIYVCKKPKVPADVIWSSQKNYH